jgi:hypothetical protein
VADGFAAGEASSPAASALILAGQDGGIGIMTRMLTRDRAHRQGRGPAPWAGAQPSAVQGLGALLIRGSAVR